jgi:SAM-dependent methyltransferase
MTRLAELSRRLMGRPRKAAELRDYWRDPPDAGNRPEAYLGAGTELRSAFLVDMLQAHAAPEARLLEIGCNVGRNLNALREAGFTRLAGIEINPQAVEAMRTRFPALAATAEIHLAPVEEIVSEIGTRAFDWIYTMAVLEHIHADSEWVFAELARIAGSGIVTVEDEQAKTWRHFPRNYQHVFEGAGLRQLSEVACGPEQGFEPGGFVARVFHRPMSSGR